MRSWIAGLGVVGVGCAPMADDRSFSLTGGFDAVQVELSNGDLSVYAVEGDAVLLDVDFGGLASSGSVDRRVEDGVLVVDYACRLCGGDVSLGVPAGLPVRAWLAHGDLSLEGLSGPVSAEVRAGAIEVDELACDADLLAHAGSIEGSWSERPLGIRAEAHVGAVELELPTGAYDLDVRATLGVVRLDAIVHDPSADAAVRAVAGAGEVALVGR